MREGQLKRTLPEGTTTRIFHEIQCAEDLDLKNPNHLRMFYLDITKTSFSYTSLQDFLIDCVGYYVFDRAEIEKLEKGHIHSIGLRAIRKMMEKGSPDQKGTGNELGEILLYAFLEDVLGAPKLYSKVELNNIGNVSSDSVHLLPMPDDDTYFQMVFGTSHIMGQLDDAVESAFVKLVAIKNAEERDGQLVSRSFLKQKFPDPKTEDFLTAILVPNEERISVPEPAFGIFLGYSIDLKKANYTNKEYPEKVVQKIEMDIRSLIDDIKKKIADLNMADHSFYIYVLPFDNAESDKKAIMQNLLMGGVQ